MAPPDEFATFEEMAVEALVPGVGGGGCAQPPLSLLLTPDPPTPPQWEESRQRAPKAALGLQHPRY